MISKKNFIEYMTRYKELVEKEYKIDEALRTLSYDFNGFVLEYHNYLILDMLKDLVNDKNDIIRYFTSECDWGKKGTDAIQNHETGQIYQLTTYEEVYDYIKMENESKI